MCTTIKLLKSDLKDAFNEPNDDIKNGVFGTYATAYDDLYPIFKKIYSDKNLRSTSFKEFKISRINDAFLIEDTEFDECDTFSDQEALLFLDLYEKYLLIEWNLIIMEP